MLLSRRKTIAVFLLGFVPALHGCGGGSGPVASNSATSVAATVFPVNRVITELATVGRRFEGSNTGSTGVRETLSVIYSQTSPGQFTRQELLTQNGVAQSTKLSTINFLAAPFRVTGWIDQVLNPVAILQGQALPESANVGDHAIFMSGSQYIQNNGLSTGDIGLTHGVTLEWTLASHSAATADLCINQTISADFISTAKLDCFEIDAAGKIVNFKGITRTHSKSIDQEVVYQ